MKKLYHFWYEKILFKCDRDLFYAHDPRLVYAEHPEGVDSDRALKFSVSLTLDFVYTILYI
jgi:hypothetical protein